MIFKEGNIIRIGRDKFDILTSRKDVDLIVKDDKVVTDRSYSAMELHKLGDKSSFPTHMLAIYDDNKEEAILFKINYEQPKLPKWVKPRSRSYGAMCYSKERVVSVKNIFIESEE